MIRDDRHPTQPSVLFIGALPEPVTGQSVACQVLLEALRAEYRVEVVDLSKRGFRQGVDSLARVVDVLRILYRVWRLQRSADLIYLTVSESLAGNVKDLLIYAACWRRLSRVIVHLHGGAGLRKILCDGEHPLRSVNAFFLRRIGAAVVLGRRHLDIYRDAVPPQRLHVVANFASDELFVATSRIHAKFAAATPLRILFLSNLLPGKGHEETLAAFQSLAVAERDALVIDFAGGFESDEARLDFEGRIRGAPQLRYHGIVRDRRKQELFESAHVFCLPTYYSYEGQPISILEAFASGCAVVTTDHSGIGDVFADGVNGLLVTVRSAESIRDAFMAALSDVARLESFAITNHETAKRRFSVAQFTSRMLDVFAQTRRLNHIR